jgi:hypothetical protein
MGLLMVRLAEVGMEVGNPYMGTRRACCIYPYETWTHYVIHFANPKVCSVVDLLCICA